MNSKSSSPDIKPETVSITIDRTQIVGVLAYNRGTHDVPFTVRDELVRRGAIVANTPDPLQEPVETSESSESESAPVDGSQA